MVSDLYITGYRICTLTFDLDDRKPWSLQTPDGTSVPNHYFLSLSEATTPHGAGCTQVKVTVAALLCQIKNHYWQDDLNKEKIKNAIFPLDNYIYKFEFYYWHMSHKVNYDLINQILKRHIYNLSGLINVVFTPYFPKLKWLLHDVLKIY